MRIEINDYIVSDSEICHGQPTFKGIRIMVWQVLEMIESGASREKIMNAFITPLTEQQIQAALHYATNLTRRKDNVRISVPIEA